MSHIEKVSAYIESLPESERQIASLLRELIITVVPDVQEKFSFGIPFYHYFGMFCYLNFQKKTGGMELAFCRGRDLMFAYPELESNERAMVAGLKIQSLKNFSGYFIKNLILSAAEWQKEAYLAQKPFVAKKKANK